MSVIASGVGTFSFGASMKEWMDEWQTAALLNFVSRKLDEAFAMKNMRVESCFFEIINKDNKELQITFCTLAKGLFSAAEPTPHIPLFDFNLPLEPTGYRCMAMSQEPVVNFHVS